MTHDTTVVERLARIETKVDSLLTRDDDHEVRIRRLERWGLLLAGALGLAGGQVSRLIGGS